MNMIEKVALAILKCRYYDPEPQMYGNDPEAFFFQLDPDQTLDAHDEARAAIAAMRDPTDAMVEALYSALDERGVQPTAAGQQDAIKESISVMMGAADQ